MEKIKDNTGKFPYRLWFKDKEIDSLMELNLYEFSKNIFQIKEPPIPVDLFVEKYLKAEFDNYAALQVGDNDILGETSFKRNGKVIIRIEKTLTEQADAKKNLGRYNFTVCHESFHALYHKELFFNDKSQLEFSEFSKTKKIQCLKRDIESYSIRKYVNVPWWEYQANIGAAALLMPKTMFLEYFVKERNAYGIKNNHRLMADEHAFKLVIGYLSERFAASEKAVKIRLKNLGFLCNTRQDDLFAEEDDVTRIGDILQ